MDPYLDPDILKYGPARLAERCNLLVAVLAFAPGDTYAAATAPANVLASVPMTPADFTFTDGPNRSVLLNNALKVDAAADAAGDPDGFLFLDTVAQTVLRATPETTTGSVSTAGSVTFPNLPLVSNQPVVA